MSSIDLDQRLVGILAADVASYSRLMAADERATVVALDAARAIFRSQIELHQGRVIDMAGDSVLAVFKTATGATSAALAIQQELAELGSSAAEDRRMRFRIGVHLGDVIEKSDGTVYGNGINIAARLQALAEPGGVVVSQSVYAEVHGKVNAEYDDLGEQTVKNIADPIHAFGVVPAKTGARAKPGDATAEAIAAIAGKPSIAVLPFNNMSGDPEQEYFSDGMVEDITTELSRSRELFVIARNSSFTYKGRAVDVRQVGRELGVRYVLEGSVRRSSNRLRVTAQLIDASTGSHLWAERFDGGLEDIFELQDKITSGVVGALFPTLELAEIVRAKRKPASSMDAYDYHLRGVAELHRFTKAGNHDAIPLFRKAIELAPDFASPYGAAAYCYCQRKAGGWSTNPAGDIEESRYFAEKAIDLGKDDAVALARGGHALAYVLNELDAGKLFSDRALTLNPSLAYAWYSSAWIHVWIGEPESALQRAAQAIRLSPRDPLLPGMRSVAAFAHFFADRYDEAAAMAESVLQERPEFHQALRAAAASYALTGKHDAARRVMARLRRIDPELRVANLQTLTPLRRSEHRIKYAKAMEDAGLPR